MEDMKINSKIRYKQSRVMNGNEPHRMLKMIQEQALKKGAYGVNLNIINTPILQRGEKMSTRSLDRCTCGHNRKDHDNFDSECEECKCEVFHRNINTGKPIVEISNNSGK
jgi:hypothetical protein